MTRNNLNNYRGSTLSLGRHHASNQKLLVNQNQNVRGSINIIRQQNNQYLKSNNGPITPRSKLKSSNIISDERNKII